MTTASLLPNPACICLNLLLPISWIQMLCKSVGRQQLHSVPLSRAITGGFSGGSRVHITFLLHVLQERLVCIHTKVLVIFIVCCCFHKWRVLLFGAISFFILCHVALLSAGCCPFHLLQILTSWGFCLPFWQWLPWTEAAGSDVW